MKISRIGKQVLTLNSLIELSHWLHTRTFTLGGGDDKSSDRQCTWTSEPVNVFHYTILSYKVILHRIRTDFDTKHFHFHYFFNMCTFTAAIRVLQLLDLLKVEMRSLHKY